MLELSDLHLWRGDRHLLRGLNLTLAPGQVLQLLWPNGTGKTSLLRTIAGFMHPEAGQVRWKGQDITAGRDAFHLDLAYLGHEPALKADLSAAENLRFATGMRNGASIPQIHDALLQVGLSGLRSDQPVRSLSAGQQRRVALARVFLWDANLWLLDEPAANLDASGQQILCDLLDRHLGGGGMALIAAHQALAVDSSLCRLWRSPAEQP
ncbi:MAG: cytochrome c biogenesis heme-transporting ATPase CcmA [Pseudomonadota bacterium]